MQFRVTKELIDLLGLEGAEEFVEEMAKVEKISEELKNKPQAIAPINCFSIVLTAGTIIALAVIAVAILKTEVV